VYCDGLGIQIDIVKIECDRFSLLTTRLSKVPLL